MNTIFPYAKVCAQQKEESIMRNQINETMGQHVKVKICTRDIGAFTDSIPCLYDGNFLQLTVQCLV